MCFKFSFKIIQILATPDASWKVIPKFWSTCRERPITKCFIHIKWHKQFISILRRSFHAVNQPDI